MDFRLGSAIRDYLNAHNLYNEVDIISVAGAAKDIAQGEGSFAQGQVDLSHKLHEIKTVILMNHTDCGGYGGRDAFDSDESERSKHEADLHAAREKLLRAHPELEVKLALAVIGADASVNVEEIE
jgi:carbonic anhydrase